MPKIELDQIDRRIISELQADGRLTNIELAERVGLSPSPCLRRVKRLEADGSQPAERMTPEQLKATMIKEYAELESQSKLLNLKIE